MTNVGWVGLGKLGLPCALALGNKGEHHIYGYDVVPDIAERVNRSAPYEAGLDDLSRDCLTVVDSLADVVSHSDIVFCAVQTPHDPLYGGEIPMPDDTKDFNYSYLEECVRNVSREATAQHKNITLVVISTVLPGTMDRHVRAHLGDYVTLVYNPFFIAMGTTVHDYTHPEFVLIGVDKPEDADTIKSIYRTVHDRDFQIMSIQSAELTKVAYNCFISMKVVFGNTVMEICEKSGADCDQVIDALSKATDRVISPSYMRGGMGDGGSCHPRDNIAMSWLAQDKSLSADPFMFVSKAREDQAQWIAQIVLESVRSTSLRVVMLGKAYKPGSNLSNGSPALLVAHYLEQSGQSVLHYDAHVDDIEGSPDIKWSEPAIFVIGTKHSEYSQFIFSKGSIVIDPFGYIPDQLGVQVRRLGRK
jgi:UDPglucose 6-dehydrogenase